MRTWPGWVVVIVLTGGVGVAEAHPGRLNAEGCHHVLKPFVYADGTRLEAGDFHCHRPLGQLTLDTRERLQDPKDPGREEQLTREEQERQ